MKRVPLQRRFLALFMAAAGLMGCQIVQHRGPVSTIQYVGSSTVAIFLREAEPVYGRVEFQIDEKPESVGGEKAIVEGKAELAGIANRPRPETLRVGIAATEIGRDAIAVIVNAGNPVTNLSLTDLRAIFTGKVQNWKELGGPDLRIRPFIVGAESATRKVFRTVVLNEAEYIGCREVRPDRDIIQIVGKNPEAIGQISFSFLNGFEALRDVRSVLVEGEEPAVTNFDYPIVRPLYLLWREGNPEIKAFVEWAQTEEGQRVVMKHFVGIRVIDSVRPAQVQAQAKMGTLIIYTETYPVYDGGIYYYPHRQYDIKSRHGELIRHVPNHRGENDESPMRVNLPPGTYLIRPETSRGDRPEFFVTIEFGRITRVYVEELLKERK